MVDAMACIAQDVHVLLLTLLVDKIMEYLAELNSPFIQIGISTKNALHIVVSLAMNAEPDLARVDVHIKQVKDDFALQNTVAVIRS